MHKSKPLSILRTLSTWERKNLEEYLHSPFFNKNQRIIDFWDLIKPYAPGFDQEDLAMERVFGAMFPGEDYDHQKLRYLMTDFTRLCEGFLAYKVWEADPIDHGLYLQRAYQEREIVKPFLEKKRKLFQQIDKLDGRSHLIYNDKFRYAEMSYYGEYELAIGKNPADHISEVMNALDELFLVKKLRYSCELINQSNVLNKHYEFFLTQELMDHMAAHPDFGSDLARLYYQALLTLQEDSEEAHFFTLKQMLYKALGNIDLDDLSDLYTCALNYSIKQLNTGNQKFVRESFELYKVLMENRIIFVKGELPLQHFKNMIALGVREKEYEWTEAFINDFKQFLPPDEAENAFTYNMAYLQEAKGNYGQVKRLLRTVEYPDVFYQLGSRAILIRTYYELEDYESLSYLLDSFRMYLRRNKALSDYQRKLYLNLDRIMRALVRYQQGARITAKEIAALLEKHPDVAARHWLKEKVAAIREGF